MFDSNNIVTEVLQSIELSESEKEKLRDSILKACHREFTRHIRESKYPTLVAGDHK